MPSPRTFVTELATALGTVGTVDVGQILRRRPRVFANLTDDQWSDLEALWRDGDYAADFEAGFANGQAFLRSTEGLAGRRPRIIEWTGGRGRPPGDEVVPSDLRIDHVYLVSCKYLSRILHNLSPSRLIEGLLSQTTTPDGRDWYERFAPVEHQALYEACREVVSDDPPLTGRATELAKADRRRLALALRPAWPAAAAPIYADLCRVVSEATATAWRERLGSVGGEVMLWRLLRVGSAPYFILGSDRHGSMRLRIDTPWDWRQAFRLRHFEITAQAGGQPRVGWAAIYDDRRRGINDLVVEGHVELRWSHGRFGQPPEAKVYLDTPHEQVPGYHPLTGCEPLDQAQPNDQPELPLE